MKQPGMDQVGLQCSMIEGPILPEQPRPGGVKGALHERKPRRRPDELRAPARDQCHETSTAVASVAFGPVLVWFLFRMAQ
jgi:hypothetical protein